MPLTKLIYGVGRVPKANEFSLGEIIVNVDDSKVYSKSKKNIVFELGTGTSTTVDTGSFYVGSSYDDNTNIITFTQGDGTTDEVDLTAIINASGDDDWYVNTGTNITSSLPIQVEGYISSSQYVILKPITFYAGITGGFMYSSSNDFYLGFS